MCIPANRRYGDYKTLEKAQEDCTNDVDCIGVYDWQCNNTEFSLCPVGYDERMSEYDSCVYMKGEGNYT